MFVNATSHVGCPARRGVVFPSPFFLSALLFQTHSLRFEIPFLFALTEGGRPPYSPMPTAWVDTTRAPPPADKIWEGALPPFVADVVRPSSLQSLGLPSF
jgi:hypothetical protein